MWYTCLYIEMTHKPSEQKFLHCMLIQISQEEGMIYSSFHQ